MKIQNALTLALQNAPQSFKGIATSKIQQAILEKQQSFAKHWLGKSLAYTPYQPRPLVLESPAVFAMHTKTFNPNTLHYIQEYAKQTSAFIVESLEILTYFRRYVEIPLIYDFLILDSYQLLEALVYGADCVMLYPRFLNQKQLQDLSNEAIKFGLERIFCIDSKEDLTKAIFAKADFLNLNDSALVPLIPKKKILFSATLDCINAKIHPIHLKVSNET